MGNVVMVGENAYKIEGDAIRVGTHFRMGKHSRAIFDDIPSSTATSIICEQQPGSSLIDADGDGARRLDQVGASEGKQAIQEINKIIEEVGWNGKWLDGAKPPCAIFFLIILHIIGLCIILCIVASKMKAIQAKRDDLMAKVREYAKKFNQSSGVVDLRIPQRFSEYVEFVTKNQGMMMGGMQQQPMMMMDPNMMYQQQMPQYYQQQPMYGNDAQQQQWNQQQQQQAQIQINYSQDPQQQQYAK